jgi:hypothetical protein
MVAVTLCTASRRQRLPIVISGEADGVTDVPSHGERSAECGSVARTLRLDAHYLAPCAPTV